jgi:hypothetical protein
VLFNSPAKAKKGFPSTINWVATPLFSKWGTELVDLVCELAVITKANSEMQLKKTIFFIIILT